MRLRVLRGAKKEIIRACSERGSIDERAQQLRFSNASLKPKIMEVRIQISDAAYASLLNGTKRIQGTLALVNPNEGNFHEHQRTWRPKPGTQYLKLPHGRITVTDEKVRMNLLISRDESVVPARAIEAESGMASSFVDFVEESV